MDFIFIFNMPVCLLEIKIELQKVDSFNISRIAQMTQKTNQFNLTTQRYSEADVRQLLDNQWINRAVFILII